MAVTVPMTLPLPPELLSRMETVYGRPTDERSDAERFILMRDKEGGRRERDFGEGKQRTARPDLPSRLQAAERHYRTLRLPTSRRRDPRPCKQTERKGLNAPFRAVGDGTGDTISKPEDESGHGNGLRTLQQDAAETINRHK